MNALRCILILLGNSPTRAFTELPGEMLPFVLRLERGADEANPRHPSEVSVNEEATGVHALNCMKGQSRNWSKVFWPALLVLAQIFTIRLCHGSSVT